MTIHLPSGRVLAALLVLAVAPGAALAADAVTPAMAAEVSADAEGCRLRPARAPTKLRNVRSSPRKSPAKEAGC